MSGVLGSFIDLVAARMAAPGPALSLDPIGLAVPVFFVLIGVELAAAKRVGREVYGVLDAISCMATGVGNQVSSIFLGAAAFALYAGLVERVALFEPAADSALTWLVCEAGGYRDRD